MSELAEAVREASLRPDLIAAVEEVYARLERGIQARKPVCKQSGRCCRFEEYGHRLYVTTAELAAFLARLNQRSTINIGGSPWDGSGCPFQVAGLCGVHLVRPFGCRIYFCDPSAREWQESLYERFHAELKRLHETSGVPYFYVEWRLALRSLPELLGGS